MSPISRRRLFAMSSLALQQALGKPDDLAWLSLEEASRLVRKRSLSPVDLTRVCLGRIERFDPALNAFITVSTERALAQARTAENELRRGAWRGPLHGIPIAVKDNIDTAGVRTTAASAIYSSRVPTEDAEVVRRLLAAGAIILGKTNLDEFAFGHSSRLSYFGAVHNPWKADIIAGGSSGGSAAAVAAGLCYGALGSDTSGSIRLPAAYCGIVGLKPTYGLVSTRGLIPNSPSLDHVGPMCRSAADVALLLKAIEGTDPPREAARMRATRIGVPRSFFFERLGAEISTAVQNAIGVLERLTSPASDVGLPGFEAAGGDTSDRLSRIWSTVLGSEAASFHGPMLNKTPELYGRETYARITGATKVTAVAYDEARRELGQLRQAIEGVFASVDILVTPTTPIPACPIETEPPREALRNTIPFNVYGLPAISIACGFTSTGLPVGLQMIGPRLGEARLLALAGAYERATNWHNRHPNGEGLAG